MSISSGGNGGEKRGRRIRDEDEGMRKKRGRSPRPWKVRAPFGCAEAAE